MVVLLFSLRCVALFCVLIAIEHIARVLTASVSLSVSKTGLRFLVYFTFFLDKKSNKKVKAIRCETFFKTQVSSAESPFGRVILLARSLGLRLCFLHATFLEGAEFFTASFLIPIDLSSEK